MGDDGSQLVPDRRVTDSERDQVVAHLRAATVEGSLDLDELGARIEQVFQARTTAELAEVTRDLPAPPPHPPGPGQPPPRSVWRNFSFRIHAASWGLTNGFLMGIWALAGGGHFWPFYPAAGWGVGLGLHAMVVAQHDRRVQRDPDRARRDAQREERRAARHELRRASQDLAIEAQRNAARAARQLGIPGAAPHVHRARTRPDRGTSGRDGRNRDGRSRDGAGPASVQRVAALFVDVVGSTQLTAAMGDEAWSGVRSRFRATVGRCLDEHGGHEVNVAGDGILARFDHETGAVRCAVGIQQALAGQRAEAGFAPSVRIGIHAGAAVADGTDLVGHVINLAARVSDAAEPDEVLVTEAVVERLDDRFQIEDRGLRSLKGIAQPRHLLAVTWR